MFFKCPLYMIHLTFLNVLTLNIIVYGDLNILTLYLTSVYKKVCVVNFNLILIATILHIIVYYSS